MALKFFDRTKQDATTTGTGTFTLATSASTGGFRTFASVHTTGDEVFYCAVDNVNNTFEVGQGTLTSGSPNWTLTRDTIKSSSNSNNAVNFAAAPEIFSTYPAENAAFSDTSLPSNVVETDAVFDETLTADKAISGQFKGTLQFNKAYFTIANYTVASGHTLTVTDSADLYAVGIASGTKMDRTADFTSDVTISSNTLFSPGINAYATVTIASGVTATVSPVGTTFVNNGAGISTGGPITWKLPTSDGVDGTEIVTDGKGGFKVKGAVAAGGPTTLTPQGETLIFDGDYNNYKGTQRYVEAIVPTSLAANTSDIESFRFDMDFVGLTSGHATNGTDFGISLQPMKNAGSSISFGTAAWDWYSKMMYNSSSSFSYRTVSASGNSNGGDWAVSGGTYYGNDIGLVISGSNNNYGAGGSDSSFPEEAFITNEADTQWNPSFTGEIRVLNQIYAPRIYYDYHTLSANTTGHINYSRITKGMAWYSQGSTSTERPITGEHARGYRLWFNPVNYSYRDSCKLAIGRIKVYANIKQSQSEITYGQISG